MLLQPRRGARQLQGAPVVLLDQTVGRGRLRGNLATSAAGEVSGGAI
jgi:hypothetical protein